MTDIEKLIFVRNIIDAYLINKNKYGKLPFLVLNRDSELENIGFLSLKEFYEFNFKMNLLEADRCFRFRKISNTDEPALCDSCSGRSVQMCIMCDMSNPAFSKLLETPNSQIIAEQQSEAERLNVTPAFFVPPICYFFNYNLGDTMPNYCVGKSHKINEPLFDVTWGMSEFINFGRNILNNMNTANGR